MNKKRVIINADDFGKSHDVNLAIVESFAKGWINQTTIMVNMPFADEAVKLALENGFFEKVGLHVVLTEGKPLNTETLSLTGIYGSNCREMNGQISSKCRSKILNHTELLILSSEIEVQIAKYKEYGFPLLHIDSHHHIHNEYQIFKIFYNLAIQNDFRSMRILRNMFPTPNISSRLKKIYKSHLNSLIRKNFVTTELFGSFDDYNKYYSDDKSVEIMVHPTLQNGRVYDVVEDRLEEMPKVLL